jgi:hypothetical protein
VIIIGVERGRTKDFGLVSIEFGGTAYVDCTSYSLLPDHILQVSLVLPRVVRVGMKAKEARRGGRGRRAMREAGSG